MSATDPVSEARELLSAADGLAYPLDWHVEHGRIVNGSGTQIASMSGSRVWMGDADLIAAAPRLLAALADEVEMMADEVRRAKAKAWDEGRASGVDIGLSIGERIVGTRSDWPSVPKNPYHAESIESQDNDETVSPEPPDENPVLVAMTEYVQAIRGDWSDFDGRTELNIIDGWVQELRQPNPSHDIEWHRRDLGICMAGGGHWCGHWGHCHDKCGCEPCAKDRSAR